MNTRRMFWCMNTNVHMQRAMDSRREEAERAERDTYVAGVIAASHRRDAIEWATAIVLVWLLAIAVDTYRTIYAAWSQTGNPMFGLSAFIGLGIIFTGMCFGVWKINR